MTTDIDSRMATDNADSMLSSNKDLSSILENLLDDYSKDVSDIYLTLYNIKEANTKWKEVSLSELGTIWDEQALKITELKEEYVKRRKTLASSIREFTSKYIDNNIDNDMKNDTKQIIELFKSNFDYLATSAKFSEAAFLSTYKLMREAQDPCILFDECTNIITSSQNSLKYAQEQILHAASYIDSYESTNISQSNTNASKEVVELKEKNQELQLLVDDLEQKLQTEKHRCENDMRKLEQKIRNDIDEQLIEQQKTHNLDLSRKEMEINSLLAAINDYKLFNIEANEKGKTLENELARRRELEEKVRSTMTELANANQTLSEFEKRNEMLQVRLNTLESEVDKERAHNKKTIDSMDAAKLKMLTQIQQMESDLLSRPPVDLSNLATKIGIIDTQCSNNMDWKTIETFLVDAIRKASSEAAESRVREQDMNKSLKFTEEENDVLKAKGITDKETIINMERDLIEAHKTIESQKALLKYQNKGSDIEHTSSPTNSAKNKSSTEPTKGRIFSPGKLKSNIDTIDVELGKIGSTAAALEGATSGDPADRMLIAVQNQRDRYMKLSMEKETELNAVKSTLERIDEEQHRLRDENLELYRRLRILRATSRQAGQENDDNDNVRIRSRRDGRSNSIEENGSSSSSSGTNSDMLEKKYMKAYEEHIDPWRVEELDRQNVISRLNVFEKALAFVIRFILQDSWARHALMVYLFLVHIFAIGYLVQVLNPQLIEEVDQSMKDRLAAATYDIAFNHADVE